LSTAVIFFAYKFYIFGQNKIIGEHLTL